MVDTAARVSGKVVTKIHIDGPLGVRGRNSNNDVVRRELGWDYSQSDEEGIRKTYEWIEEQIQLKGQMTIGYNRLGSNGRLGNQMFQYAALRGITTHRGFRLYDSSSR